MKRITITEERLERRWITYTVEVGEGFPPHPCVDGVTNEHYDELHDAISMMDGKTESVEPRESSIYWEVEA